MSDRARRTCSSHRHRTARRLAWRSPGSQRAYRSVAVAGLFAGGMAFGAGMMRLILQWRGQLRD